MAAIATVGTVKVAYSEAEAIRCVARVDMSEYDLHAGDVFYLMRSSKNDGTYYITRYDASAMRWFCGCPAHKPCKHEKAAALASRQRYLARYQPASISVRVMKPPTPQKPATIKPDKKRREIAPLNGNRGFSFYR